MKMLTSEIVSVDMEFAFKWLANPFFGQRPISRFNVTQYKNDMAAGRWNLGEGQIIIGVRPSASFLLAGNHRLTAIYELETVRVDMRVTFIEFDTDDEMTAFYALGTNKGKAMSLSASLQVFGTGEAIGIPVTHVGAFAATIAFLANGFEHRNVNNSNAAPIRSPEVVDAIMRAWQGPIYSYYRALDGCGKPDRPFYLRMPVIAIGIVTMRFCPEKALEFWTKTAQNDGLRKGEPEHALHNFLSHNQIAAVGYYDYTCTIAACWNSFYSGEERRVLTPRGGRTEKGIYIKGTPWNGNGTADPLVILGVNKLQVCSGGAAK